jgi:hypothetical protein
MKQGSTDSEPPVVTLGELSDRLFGIRSEFAIEDPPLRRDFEHTGLTP